jgi:hypothetical protein
VREERVALKDHAEVAPLGGKPRDRGAIEQDVAARHILKPGDHHQQRRLARSRGTKQGQERPPRDVECHIVDRDHLAVALGHGLQQQPAG